MLLAIMYEVCFPTYFHLKVFFVLHFINSLSKNEKRIFLQRTTSANPYITRAFGQQQTESRQYLNLFLSNLVSDNRQFAEMKLLS